MTHFLWLWAGQLWTANETFSFLEVIQDARWPPRYFPVPNYSTTSLWSGSKVTNAQWKRIEVPKQHSEGHSIFKLHFQKQKSVLWTLLNLSEAFNSSTYSDVKWKITDIFKISNFLPFRTIWGPFKHFCYNKLHLVQRAYLIPGLFVAECFFYSNTRNISTTLQILQKENFKVWSTVLVIFGTSFPKKAANFPMKGVLLD